MKKILTISLFAFTYVAFFEFPKYYNEVPLLKFNEVTKWIYLIPCILDVLFLLFGRKHYQKCDKK